MGKLRKFFINSFCLTSEDWLFTEIWLDITAIPPYVLMLLGDRDGNFAIYDPKEDYKLIFACSSYEEAKLWLLEDEYERIEGQLLSKEVE